MSLSTSPRSTGGDSHHRLPRCLRWIALLLLCAAYLQGGLVKLFDFPSAIAEMQHFGLSPAGPLAAATIVLELGASAMILSGIGRWLGALALAAFTLAASFLANSFWNAPPDVRFGMANSFFEHLGLVGGFVFVAWHDLRTPGR
jgi:uncharacterized membrane protein YphA (DoxX/SURF4 family)